MSMSVVRRLAERLAVLSDDALEAILRRRGVSLRVEWHDFYDAAEALTTAESLRAAVTRLSREQLTALAAGDASELPELADGDGVLSTVSDLVTELAGSLPQSASRHGATLATEDGLAHAAERIFRTLTAVAELILIAGDGALLRVTGNVLAAAERRRLLADGVVDDPEELEALIALAVQAGLLVTTERTWRVGPSADKWLRATVGERWATLARAWHLSAPEALYSESGMLSDPDGWAEVFPLDSAWPMRADRLRRSAGLLGLLDPEGATTGWTPDEPGIPAARVPSDVDRLFLQNDLTAIAPGPLAPALDQRLRRMSLRDSRGQASSYRFTEASLAAALTRGEDPKGLREFLTEISLTGLPQPLAYLLDRAAQRHGLVRVGCPPSGEGAVVTSTEPGILQAIAVDQSLRPLALKPTGSTLLSAATAETVLAALIQARYPALAALPDTERNADGDHSDDTVPGYGPLIAQLRAGQPADPEAAWLERSLEQAVRARETIAVTVAMPDGTETEFVVEAVGLGGGRLRGRDRTADVERTVPVAFIRAVRSAAAPPPRR